MSHDWLLGSADELAARVPDGAKIAVPHDSLGAALETTRALIRRGVRDLHLVCVPMSGLQADLLIGAGCVGTLETSAISFGEHGTPYRDGNVFIGRRRDLATMAQASTRGALITVERVRDDVDLMASEETAAGTLPAIYVEHAAIAQRGAWPCGLWDEYPIDEPHFRRYGELARTADGFARYLEEFVQVRRQAAE